MIFIDSYNGEKYSLRRLWEDWKEFKKFDSYNHAPDFIAEFYEILMATINGRNDFDIIGMTTKETNNYVLSLRDKIERR